MSSDPGATFRWKCPNCHFQKFFLRPYDAAPPSCPSTLTCRGKAMVPDPEYKDPLPAG